MENIMETKICSKCSAERPISEFCVDKSRPDGKHPWCKECRAASAKHRMLTDPLARQSAREAVRRYRQTEKGKAYNRNYYQIHKKQFREWEQIRNKRPDVKEYLANKQRLYRLRNPEKENARHAVYSAVRFGHLARSKFCEWCGGAFQDGDEVEIHHWHGYDPEHWLDVKFVHVVCHRNCENALEKDWPILTPI
jgi:hypothetical protein